MGRINKGLNCYEDKLAMKKSHAAFGVLEKGVEY